MAIPLSPQQGSLLAAVLAPSLPHSFSLSLILSLSLVLLWSCGLNAGSQVSASGKGDTSSRLCFHPLSRALSFFHCLLLPTQVPQPSLQQTLSSLSEQRRERHLFSCLLFNFFPSCETVLQGRQSKEYILILQKGNLRLRETEWPAQGHRRL